MEDWYDYFQKKISKHDLEYLLLKTSYNGIDSVFSYYKGKINVLPDTMPQLKQLKLNKKQVTSFFDYLLLAKSSEEYSTNYKPYYSWDEKQTFGAPKILEQPLLTAFEKEKDPFIKQRLWFQLVRYYFFVERATPPAATDQSKVLSVYNAYKDTFPKNTIYYRVLGYVAGKLYSDGKYANANYLYSLCYDYATEMKIPSKWAFRPMNEKDWKECLSYAKTDQEKITLWHMLGIYYEAERAIPEIMALDPKSDKLDLLLSRVVNTTENSLDSYYSSAPDSTAKALLKKNTALVTAIALKNNTSKPYFWDLAAGYLNFLSKNYVQAGKFYQSAKTQLPKDNLLLAAQYKILDWGLYIKQLKKIDAKTEAQMVEPLTWFARLKQGKDTIPDLRFYKALNQSLGVISDLYKKQGDPVKAVLFTNYNAFYTNNQQIERLKTLLLKSNKTPFEQAMVAYYPYKIEDLYFYQATTLTYQEKLDEAMALLEKSGKGRENLPGNPFNIRLNDCHDCDHQMAQSKKFSSMGMLKMMKNMKTELDAGRNVYNNALLLANAYYNITHYGNARAFYESDLTDSYTSSAFTIPSEFRPMLTSGKIAEKYYLIAREATANREQKARCTFLASKCERNDSYNKAYDLPENKKAYWSMQINEIFYGQYFATLRQQYANTKFYQEALRECGYFRKYNKY